MKASSTCARDNGLSMLLAVQIMDGAAGTQADLQLCWCLLVLCHKRLHQLIDA
jgi:hypothetical protein